MTRITVLATCVLVSSLGVEAFASLHITPATTPQWTTNDNSNLTIAEIKTLTGFMGDLTSLYKANVGGPEEKAFQNNYTTVFANSASDPEDATITWDGPLFIDNAQFLLVKDGNRSPAQYVFDISSTGLNWDGKETIELTGFWPQQGAISHIEILGSDDNQVVPEPAAVAVWAGLGLIGLAYARRRSRRAA